MTVVTTTPQILDVNGANGFGKVTITPSQAFTYYDGAATISVTNDSTIIGVTNGQLDSSLVLAPTSGASNAPEVYYIVELDLNGTLQTILWSLPSPASTTEFNDVQKIASGTSVDSAVSSLLEASNPFKQYLTRTDTRDTKDAGAVSDGRGAVPRAGVTNGFIDKSFYTASGTGDSALTAADVPITDAGGIITATEVEAALQENRGIINANTADIATNTADIATNTADIATNVAGVSANAADVALKLDKAVGSATVTVSLDGTGGSNPTAIYTLPSYDSRTYFAFGPDDFSSGNLNVLLNFKGTATVQGPRYLHGQNLSASPASFDVRCWYFTP